MTGRVKADLSHTEASILSILENDLHLEVPHGDTELLKAGIIDSLAFVDLVFSLERRFEITIDLQDVDFDDFKSVRSIALFVNRQLGQR